MKTTKFQFKLDESVEPKDFINNANLSLHHHMAPPGEIGEDKNGKSTGNK